MLAFLSPDVRDASTRAGFVLMTVAPVLWVPGVLVVRELSSRLHRWRRRRAEEADATWLPPARPPRD
jgi:hypothetical protein